MVRALDMGGAVGKGCGLSQTGSRMTAAGEESENRENGWELNIDEHWNLASARKSWATFMEGSVRCPERSVTTVDAGNQKKTAEGHGELRRTTPGPRGKWDGYWECGQENNSRSRLTKTRVRKVTETMEMKPGKPCVTTWSPCRAFSGSPADRASSPPNGRLGPRRALLRQTAPLRYWDNSLPGCSWSLPAGIRECSRAAGRTDRRASAVARTHTNTRNAARVPSGDGDLGYARSGGENVETEDFA